MKVHGKPYRTIWVKEGDKSIIRVIDQRRLPHEFIIEDIASADQMAVAIKDMHVRGAGLIGAAAGYAMYLAVAEAAKSNAFDTRLAESVNKILSARPTAVNLSWAVSRQLDAIKNAGPPREKMEIAFRTAGQIADEDAEHCRKIGEAGVELLRNIYSKKNGKAVNVLTHCNAGWLAFVDYGSATAPIYAAHDEGIKIHVWVDETRPRNQGSKLTAWELKEHGVPHTIIVDNAGGHLMQQGLVDMVITGTDRTTFTGDVCNKTGTYLKALAAKDNNIPFYVALPSSSFDWNLRSGNEIPIEQRNENEVKYMEGFCDGETKEVLLAPEDSPAANYGFDITPSRLVTGLITERGICEANERSILQLFPEHKK